ncbi:MAG: Hsp20/alpha crystallin family protein [Burkholderiaceae bacterium]|nr:Hsp20/alpha crystallin family protein [Burkholderiaceae bacterium]
MYESMLNFPGSMFIEFDRLRRDLDDLFGAPSPPSSIRSVAPGSFPAINVGNTPNSVEIYAFAPGIDASKLDVSIDRGVLTIAGERPPTQPSADQQASVYNRERVSGGFKRAVSLPDEVDSGQVQASYRDGVVRVSIARREEAQPKRITIQ